MSSIHHMICIIIIMMKITTQINAQNLASGLVSITPNQNCVLLDPSIKTDQSNNANFECGTYTSMVIDVASSSTDVSSATSFTIEALPNNGGQYNTNFYNNGNMNDFCSPTNQVAGCTPLNQTYQVELTMTPVFASFNLIDTGITIPYGYFFSTCAYPMTQAFSANSCGQDPNTHVYGNTLKNSQYAKATNAMTVDKTHVPNTPGEFDSTQIFADRLLSQFSWQCPGSIFGPPQSSSSTQQTIDPSYLYGGGFTYEFQGSSFKVLDVIFDRWLNGTLGAGGAIDFNNPLYREVNPSCLNPSQTEFVNSECLCNNPVSYNTHRQTYPVCPGNPMPELNQKDGYNFPTFCVGGPCAGTDEAWCPLVAGLQYAMSRCMQSKQLALNVVNEFYTKQLEPRSQSQWTCNQAFVQQGCQNGENCYELYVAWLNCMNSYQLNVTALNQSLTFQEITSDYYCSQMLIQASTLARYAADQNNEGCSGQTYCAKCPWPFIGDYFQSSYSTTYQGHNCMIPTSYGNLYEKPQEKMMTKLCTPFLPEHNPVGFCAGQFDHGDPTLFASPIITQSSCQCACNIGWQDQAIPIGPTCQVYQIQQNAIAKYNVTANITSPDNPDFGSYALKVGWGLDPSSPESQTTFAISPDLRIALKELNIPQPQGATSATLNGYIVICNAAGQDFIGTSQPNGLASPWKLGNQSGIDMRARAPLPSTMMQLNQAGITYNATKGDLGQFSWWYYVPPNEMNQYGPGCNQNGWMQYGSFDSVSSNTMCNNRPGTCVPGYDVTQYNAQTYNQTNPYDGYPQLFPTTKTPLYIARTFVKFEQTGLSGATAEYPQNLPPGWDLFEGSCWVHMNQLICDKAVGGGAIYQNAFSRVQLSFEGTLIGAETSFSSGKLVYPDGTESLSPSVALNPLGSCYVDLSSQSGLIQVGVSNTGGNNGFYDLFANCTSGTSADPLHNVQVNAGGTSIYQMMLHFLPLTDTNSPECLVTMVLGDTPYVLSQLLYTCVITEAGYFGPGTIVTVDPYLLQNTINSAAGQDHTSKGLCSWAGGAICNPFAVKGKMLTIIAIVGLFTIAMIVLSSLVVRQFRQRAYKTQIRLDAERAKMKKQDKELYATAKAQANLNLLSSSSTPTSMTT